MKGWRSSRKRPPAQQPTLPGLLDSPDRPARRRLTTPQEYALDRARLRLVFVLVMFGIVYAVIAGRLTSLTLLNDTAEPPPIHAASAEMPTASRADIVDRNGIVLATSLPTVSLCADAKKVISPGEVTEKLRSVLPDLDNKRLAEDLEGTKRCAMIKRHLTPRQYYDINKMGIAGLEFLPDETRIYPIGRLMSHVLGYTDIDNKGIAGLEKTLNERLEQQPDPVALTLDLRLQTILHRELGNAIDEFRAVGAAGLILDAQSGEILSLVSLPDFDPQHAGEASDDAKFNRATLGVYEMGSTFKVFTTAMALDSGLIKPSDRFDTTHPLQAGKRTIRDFHPSRHPLNVAEIFMESSNIGAARMAEKLGSARQRAFLSRLGLTEKSPIELPEVGQPLVPSPSGWSNVTTMTVAFGHGIAVSAAQLAAAVASLVNDGSPLRPTLLKRNAETGPAASGGRIVSPRTVAQMRALMRLAVTDGTAKAANIPGYIVGGKTGTADKLSGGHYMKNARLASFIGVFPANAPRYVVLAILDDPKGNAKTYGFATGGWTAAPVTGRVISQMGPLLNLPPQDPDVLAAAENKLMRPLGPETLNSLRLNNEKDDYASVESNSAE
ncbi:MAG: penicillin-binding protein 2 [Alphaproteobacteria bacterium]|nr:penicillin-binding protein 2 [Alphaproteobacteria bacterium]